MWIDGMYHTVLHRKKHESVSKKSFFKFSISFPFVSFGSDGVEEMAQLVRVLCWKQF